MVHYQTDFIPEYRPCRRFSLFSTKGWWLNKWPILGWLETFVKIGAWLFVPLITRGTYRTDTVDDASKPYVAKQFAMEVFIMFIASALLAAAIIDRMVYREIVSMIFVFPNNWAHWTVLQHMYQRGRAGINTKYFRAFCWLMFAGDVVKLVFFAVHDFSRLNVSRYFLYLLVALFAAFYAAILALDYGYFPHIAALSYDTMGLSSYIPALRHM